MRADRLLSIILLLQRHGTLTAGQLSHELEVSERTILRDITSLSIAGIPVYAERGSKGGFRLVEGYELDLSGLNSREIRALFLHENGKAMKDLGWQQDAATARHKLSYAIPKEQLPLTFDLAQRFYIDDSPWFSREAPTSSYLRQIEDAVWEQRCLRISYQKPDNSMSIRVISPYALVAKAGLWYLVAERNGEFRVYRVSRIQHVSVLTQSFTRTSSFDLQEFWHKFTQEFEATRPIYDTVLWVNTSTYTDFINSTPFVTVDVKPEVKPTAPEGFVTIRVKYETLKAACRHILGFGNAIRVVEPLELQTAVTHHAQGILNDLPPSPLIV